MSFKDKAKGFCEFIGGTDFQRSTEGWQFRIPREGLIIVVKEDVADPPKEAV